MEYKKAQSGISLIEVSIILVVFGLVLTSVLKTVMFVRAQEVRAEYFDAPRLIGATLEEYALINGHYPTPAAADLDITNANYGVPVPVVNLPDFSAGECAAGQAAVNGVLCRIGQRDLDTPGNGIGEDIEETILIGILPTTVLGLHSEESLDMHGARFTYAISSSLIDPATFLNDNGVISVKSHEGGNPNALDTNNDVHYVVISHGANQSGAYRSDGTRTACPASLGTLERENCNDDSIFMALTDGDEDNPGSTNVKLATTIQNAGGQFLDDSIFFTSKIDTNLWAARGFSSMNMTSGVDDGTTRILLGAIDFSTGPSDIAHLTRGEEPQAWINGSARGDSFISERICEQGQDSCFLISDIATPTNPSSATKTLRCVGGERGLKSVTRLSHNSGTWGKKGSNGEADGTCDVVTRVVANRNTLIGSNSFDRTTGIICANGVQGINAAGGFICN